MSQEIVAKRYAVALFELANEKGMLQSVQEELKEIEKVFSNDQTLMTVLKHPGISKDQKKEMIKNSFAGSSDIVLNTLLILIDRKREEIVPEMVSHYAQLANDASGVAEATVYSVRELTDDEEKALSEIFAKRIGKNSLRINNIVDQSLVGGVMLRIGNRIFDGSVKGKLERIERQLVSAKS